jgi:arginyl-tRNA synthetase
VEFADQFERDGVAQCRALAIASQRAEQERDLADFGVRFDTQLCESELYRAGRIEETLTLLREKHLTYERDGALWFKTQQLGDEKDRVLRKQDGSYTYFLPDIAYHRDKATRQFDRAIDVWGADHHGYSPRMSAALRALGMPAGFFEVVLVQLVKIMRRGVEVRFSKRSGDFVTLRDLFEETGVDAARYFFLMRRGDAQFVFDIDLATKQSDENPVYYVQYAHTRIAGIFRTAGRSPATAVPDDADLAQLGSPDEQTIIKQLAQYPSVVRKAADALEPHRVTGYLEELARLVNSWYHGHRVVGVAAPLEQARLVLARAIQIVLANGLHLLGVTAPERM